MYEKFIEIARRIVSTEAKRIARRLNHEHVDVTHLLLALLETEDVLVKTILVNCGSNSPNWIKDELRAIMVARHASFNMEPKLTPKSVKVLEHAISEAEKMEVNVGLEHILLGIILEGESEAAKVLSDSGLTANNVRDEIMAIFKTHYRSKGELKKKVEGKNTPPTTINILMYMTTKMNWYEIRRSINNVVKKLNLTGARTTLVMAASTSCDDGHTIPYLVVRGTDWEKIHLVAEELEHLNFLIEVEQITKIIGVQPTTTASRPSNLPQADGKLPGVPHLTCEDCGHPMNRFGSTYTCPECGSKTDGSGTHGGEEQ